MIKIATKAGQIVPDAESELIDMASGYRDMVPQKRVQDILANYDITPEDLSGVSDDNGGEDKFVSIDQLADRGYFEENDEEDVEDVPVRGRADAYDATLDVADPEDMAGKISKSDIDTATNAPTLINRDMNDDDDDEDDGEINTDFDDSEVKFVSSKTRPGVFGLMIRVGGKVVGVEDVPPQYIELAKKHPKVALAKIKSEKQIPDEELMEETDKHFGINK